MTSTFRLELLKPSQYHIWDDLVDNSPQGTLFHKSWWLKTVAEKRGTDLCLLGVFRGDDLVGGCSISEEKRFFFKLAFSPPIKSATAYGGIIIVGSDAKNIKKNEFMNNSVIESVSDYCLEHYDYSQILNSPALTDIRPFLWKGWDESVYYTYILFLNNFPSLKDLSLHYDGSVRWSINKAEKNTVEILTVNDDIDLIYDLLMESYAWHKEDAPLSKNLFTALMKELNNRGACKTYVAYHDDCPISFGTFLFYKNSASYWLGGSRRDTLNLEGSSAVLGHALKEALSDKISYIDFIGANTHPIAKFKSAFNPQIIPYYNAEWAKLRTKFAKSLYSVF
ncbi:GNAT family N-acetyltransferase [Methanofollis tationis]|uniref:GNAT family N-acetyltransferase n=1 Tax=Methanofollis tationis TaxID=81417 RepID=A0A7K4HM70_9EURY|nr:GNAT family N-acetyltransferase [Methanofollis tationis]NVO66030.1 GNAT family N-acetyltransferase [Methanofollis tationis]